MDNSGAAAKMVKRRFPQAAQWGDIRPLVAQADDYAKVFWDAARISEQQLTTVALACGLPCRELSGTNQTRRGL